ncbi:MAG: aspartate/glutamate racemase family protein, partial [Pseudomonadota bacterium]
MRILCLNANTTEFVTETVAGEMRATLGEAAEIVPETAGFGPAVIRTRLDHVVAGHAVVERAAAHAGAVDGIMLAVSFDTALDALRAALPIPVVGMTEASLAMARMLGGRIGYLSMGADVTPLYRDTLGAYDLDRDMAGWRALEAPEAYRPGDKSALDAALGEAAAGLAAEGADVVVLVGAVLAGAARRVQPGAPVPLVDGGRAGALMIRAMVALGAPPRRVGSFAGAAGGG